MALAVRPHAPGHSQGGMDGSPLASRASSLSSSVSHVGQMTDTGVCALKIGTGSRETTCVFRKLSAAGPRWFRIWFWHAPRERRCRKGPTSAPIPFRKQKPQLPPSVFRSTVLSSSHAGARWAVEAVFAHDFRCMRAHPPRHTHPPMAISNTLPPPHARAAPAVAAKKGAKGPGAAVSDPAAADPKAAAKQAAANAAKKGAVKAQRR